MRTVIREEALVNLSELYHTDETAWLEQMAALATEGDTASMDLGHLREYLSDIVKRDKREVFHRLVVLLVHLLKWEHQPAQRSNSWEATILHQRNELSDLLESGTLYAYAESVIDTAYERAVKQAALETGLAEDTFPATCPWTLEAILGRE